MIINLGNYGKKNATVNTDKACNNHIAIIGKSGMGKSVKIQKIICELVKQQATVVALDIHNILGSGQIHTAYENVWNEYVHSIDVYNQGISFPLFEPAFFADGEREKDIDIIDSVTHMIGDATKLGSKQKRILKEAVNRVYQKGLYNDCGMLSLKHELETMKQNVGLDVLSKISPIIEHNVFRNGESFIVPGKINVLRLSKFSSAVQSIMSEVVMNLLWYLAGKGQFFENGLFVTADEFQNLDTGKNGIIGSILREGRKYNLNLILATQTLSEIEYMKTMVLQASTVLFFQPARDEISKCAKLIYSGKDKKKIDSWINLLSSLSRGTFIACAPIMFGDKEIKEPLLINDFIQP